MKLLNIFKKLSGKRWIDSKIPNFCFHTEVCWKTLLTPVPPSVTDTTKTLKTLFFFFSVVATNTPHLSVSTWDCHSPYFCWMICKDPFQLVDISCNTDSGKSFHLPKTFQKKKPHKLKVYTKKIQIHLNGES